MRRGGHYHSGHAAENLQGAVLLLNGPMQVVSSVGEANQSGILDFHRASPRPPTDQALGFLHLGLSVASATVLVGADGRRLDDRCD